MKRFFYVVMLALGLSIMVCSCEKEGVEADKGILEGKWWVPVKIESLFNGKIVKNENLIVSDYYYKAYFERGNCTLIDLYYNDREVLPYSFLGDVLTIEAQEFHILKLSKNEAVFDVYASEDAWYGYYLPDDLSKGKVVDTFEGTDIYYDGHLTHWYFDSKGNAVICAKQNGKDYYYDTIRGYFKVE